MTDITTDLVWSEIEKNLFAVLGMVTAKNEARTVGIVYIAHDRTLYIGTKSSAWKAKHIANNGSVSLTVTIPKRIPLLPWIKIPAATITFSGKAKVVPATDLDADVIEPLYRGLTDNDELMAGSSVIIVEPVGEFITYGVGISLMQMRDTEKARGRVRTK